MSSWRLSSRQLAYGVVVLCVILTLSGVAIATTVPILGTGPSSAISAFMMLAPLVGSILLLAALGVAIRTERERHSVPLREVDEVKSTSPTPAIESRTDRVLSAVADGRYRDRSSGLDDDIRAQLRSGAITAMRTRGLDPETAREAVRNGEWTPDPVAAAFLAERPNYPLSERLRGALDPGLAYRRRVRRTLDAIDQLGASQVGGEKQ